MFPMYNFSEFFFHSSKFVTICAHSKFLRNYFSGIFISSSVKTLDYNDGGKKVTPSNKFPYHRQK